MAAFGNYRVTMLPRAFLSPFSEPVIVDTVELPKFSGGAVIITRPRDLGDTTGEPLAPPPAFMAWPLDMLSAVHVVDMDDDQ